MVFAGTHVGISAMDDNRGTWMWTETTSVGVRDEKFVPTRLSIHLSNMPYRAPPHLYTILVPWLGASNGSYEGSPRFRITPESTVTSSFFAPT